MDKKEERQVIRSNYQRKKVSKITFPTLALEFVTYRMQKKEQCTLMFGFKGKDNLKYDAEK